MEARRREDMPQCITCLEQSDGVMQGESVVDGWSEKEGRNG